MKIYSLRIRQPDGTTAMEALVGAYEIERRQDIDTQSEWDRLTIQLALPVLITPMEPRPKNGLWLAAVDYVHREIHAANRALANAQNRSGVTREELENLEKKIAVLDWLARLAIDKGEYV